MRTRRQNTRHRDVAGYQLEGRVERAARRLLAGNALRALPEKNGVVELVPAQLSDIRDEDFRQRVEAKLKQMERRRDA